MNANGTPRGAWTHPGFARVAEEVRARAGLVFPPNRVPGAEGGIRRAMASIGIADVDRYADVITGGGAAFEELMAELTIGETYFFRERQQLEFLRHEVLPAFRETFPPGRPLRVWSAGCASGEEAYSLAIVLREAGFGERSRVIGTDVSRPRIAAARRGEYSRWSLRGVEPRIVSRYFTRKGSRFMLDPDIRQAVEFRHLNLAGAEWPSSSSGVAAADIILCRNVLIYFEQHAIVEVARRLVSALSPEGWLFLGASDPAIGDIAPVEVLVTSAGLAYRRAAGRAAGPVTWRAAPATAGAGERTVVRTVSRDVEESAPLRASTVEALPELPPPLPQAHAQPENVPQPIADAYRNRDYGRVVALAERDVETGDGDPAVWVLLVRALANSGRAEEAAQASAAALDRHRASAELLHLQATLHLQLGNAAAAAASARRALYLDRNMIAAHLVLGAALARADEHDGARRAYLNALVLAERMPGDAEVPGTDGEPAQRIVGVARMQAAAHARAAR